MKSLELFQKMNAGEIEEGKMVLRAKIDMANPNMHFRDPIIYRVVKTPHHRTGDKWKAYVRRLKGDGKVFPQCPLDIVGKHIVLWV